METQYIYLIVILVVFAALGLAVILRYRKSKVSIKGPGVSLEMEGETGPEQPAPLRTGPSAKTTISGKVSGSTVITSAGGGEAETDVGEDVEKSDILTEA